MASDLSDLAWASKANEVRNRLPDPDADRDALGRLILERLTTFGPFYQDLADRRRFDALVRAAQQTNAVAPTAAVAATVTLGGLRLTAGLVGAAGNALRVTVAPGAATTFRPRTVDYVASQRQLGFAVDALSGLIPSLSPDPTVAALQQQCAAFLSSLDDVTRAEAEATIRARWDDSRVARAELEPPRIRDATEKACKDVGLDDDQVADAMATFDAVEQQKAAGAASVFSLAITNGSAVETFSEIVSGYDFALRNSVLLAGFEWLSGERPADGEHAFSGGVDPAPGSEIGSDRPAGDYVFRLDAFRSYTLPELETILRDAMTAADGWLA